jgi:hypothetical protein
VAHPMAAELARDSVRDAQAVVAATRPQIELAEAKQARDLERLTRRRALLAEREAELAARERSAGRPPAEPEAVPSAEPTVCAVEGCKAWLPAGAVLCDTHGRPGAPGCLREGCPRPAADRAQFCPEHRWS